MSSDSRDIASPNQHLRPQRFLILARSAGVPSSNLVEVLNGFGETEVILDSPGEGGYWYDDNTVAGYGGLMSSSGKFPHLTAWSRAMYHLKRVLSGNIEEDIWFVEDDVAGDIDSFAGLIRATQKKMVDFAAFEVKSKAADSEWPHWHYSENFFDNPYRAFKPLSVKSSKLVRLALDFRDTYGEFIFHEVLFPSLALREGLSFLDWNKEDEVSNLLGDFRYRPALERIICGVSHPVKNPDLHSIICSLRRSSMEGPIWSFATPDAGGASFKEVPIGQDEFACLTTLLTEFEGKAVISFGYKAACVAAVASVCARLTCVVFNSREMEQAQEASQNGKLFECLQLDEHSLGSFAMESDLTIILNSSQCSLGLLRSLTRLWSLRLRPFVLHDVRHIKVQRILRSLASSSYDVLRIETKLGFAVLRPRSIPNSSSGCPTHAGGRHLKSGSPEGVVFLWKSYFGAAKPTRILEIGALNGESSCAILDRIFPNSESVLHAVDTFHGEETAERNSERCGEAFAEVVSASGCGDRVHYYQGEALEVLSWMIAVDGYWESFEFAVIESWTDAKDLVSTACLVWSLLAIGGNLMINLRREPSPVSTRPLSNLMEILDHRCRIKILGDYAALMRIA